MSDAGPVRPRFTSLQLHPRNLFLPLTVLLVLVLRWKFAMPLWGLAIFLSILPVYYFLLPRLVRRGERELERDVLRLLQRGKRGELLGAYRRRWLLRLLSPPERLQRLLGLIYAESGDHARAAACYERAARRAQPGERLGVLMGLGKARYRAGDYEGAEAVYRELLRRGQPLPEVLGGLAHALLLQERDLGEALRVARKAVEETPEGPGRAAQRLTLAEALLLRGKPGRARAELEKVEPPRGEAWLEARHRWVEALLAESDGELDEAIDLLGRVADLDVKGGLGDLARRRIAELEDEEPEPPREAG